MTAVTQITDLPAIPGGTLDPESIFYVVMGGVSYRCTAAQIALMSGTNIPGGLANQILYQTAPGDTGFIPTANNGVLITSAGGVPSIGSTLPAAVQGNITALGTIGSGTWHGSVVTGTYGGTGINNGASTITLGGNVSFGGAVTLNGVFPFTGTVTGSTNITFPTSGTLSTTTGTVTTASVMSANGFAGSVATATTTPAITLSTTVNAPVLAGNGTAISAGATTGTGSTVVLSASPTLTGTPALAAATGASLVVTGALAAGTNIGWTSSTTLSASSNGAVKITNAAATAGGVLDLATDSTFKYFARNGSTPAFLQGGPLTLTGGTVVVSTPLLSATQTWNDGAVAFTGISLNVTNSASDSGSNLLDLKIGGSTVFKVSRAGATTMSSALAVTAGSVSILAGGITIAQANGYRFLNWGGLQANADGVHMLTNDAVTAYSRLQFGGTTTSFPSLKRSTATLQAKLADDSAFTFMQAQLQTSVAATTGLSAGVLAATTNASIVLYDSTGQAYRVPCVI